MENKKSTDRVSANKIYKCINITILVNPISRLVARPYGESTSVQRQLPMHRT